MSDPAGAPVRIPDDAPDPRPRPAVIAIVALAAALAAYGFVSLGLWQVERRAWKLDLIARVEAGLKAPPAAPPPAAEYVPTRDEYRRVTVSGSFDGARETFVQAATELGSGYWVLVPLTTADGGCVLINRGFVPPEKRDAALRQAPADPVTITGLLRVTELKGAFLRDNDPAENLWRSRDVAEIARARGLEDCAPYFIDADKTPNPGGFPVGGLTVVRFSNNHLVYALTWFALALMAVGAGGLVVRAEFLRGRAANDPD